MFLGKAFLELAEVSGGYYFSNEKKLGTGFVNEVLLTPRFVYVWMNAARVSLLICCQSSWRRMLGIFLSIL